SSRTTGNHLVNGTSFFHFTLDTHAQGFKTLDTLVHEATFIGSGTTGEIRKSNSAPIAAASKRAIAVLSAITSEHCPPGVAWPNGKPGAGESSTRRPSIT